MAENNIEEGNDLVLDEEVEKSLQEAQKRDEERTQEFEEEFRKQMEEKVRDLTERATRAMESRMVDFENRYHSHTKDVRDSITTKQTDILRINKMIRDVSRALGPGEWKPLFTALMSSFPQDIVNAEMEKIEQERPFMQAYKALSKWKELKGQDFKAYELSEGLRACDNYELAGIVLDILDSKYHCLFYSFWHFSHTSRQARPTDGNY